VDGSVKENNKAEFTKQEVEANNKIYLARQEKYKTYGYDNEKERLFILNAAEPFNGRIMEAGTGKGYLTLEILKRGHKLITYDVDPQIQRIARMNIECLGLSENVYFVLQDKEKLEFFDKSFDVIFCVNTLHHIENSGAVIDELLRVLADGGRLILSDFTKKGFDTMARLHESEGGQHEVIGWSMEKAALHIKRKGYQIKEVSDEYQLVYIIKRTEK